LAIEQRTFHFPAAMAGASGTVLALMERKTSGKGRHTATR
jgi:crotonobetainyl-CoA:carnitine CoA-transferase CaiB-like acyl-CoA transferase